MSKFNGFPRPGKDSGNSIIKSIQRGTTALTYSPELTSVAIPVTPVDKTKSILLFGTHHNSGSSVKFTSVTGVITNDSTITFTRYYGTECLVTIDWVLVEFNNIKSIQSGEVVSTNSPDVVSINEVNTNKALVFYSIRVNYANDSSHYLMLSGVLTNANTVTFTGVATAHTISWFVVEFN